MGCSVHSGSSFWVLLKVSKTCLVIRPDNEQVAKAVFGVSGITITTEEKRHLGAALGSNFDQSLMKFCVTSR